MAIGVTREDSITGVQTAKRNYTVPLMLMVSLYFGIGFITALNDILVPHFKDLFHLTNVTALLVQFCFFTAYFVMSVPSGWIISRIGYKKGIVLALAVMGLGLLLFLPASVIIFYPLFLFVVGGASFTSLLIAQCIVAMVQSLYTGTIPSILAEMFPTRVRYTAIIAA